MLTSTVLLSLPLLTTALPSLTPRYTAEVVYISRCIADSGANNQLEADYYANIAQSQSHQTPDAISNPQFVTGEPNFDGHHSYFFPSSGVTFTYDAQSAGKQPGQQVGTGSNGSPFTCFEDTDRDLYYRNGQSNRPCVAVFYCRKN